MAEKNKELEIIEEIKEIFHFLSEEEPTPDEEIKARETLIEKFSKIKSSDQFVQQVNIIDDILDLLEKWDTLELWFKEVEPLVNRISMFLVRVTEDKDIGKGLIKQLVNDTMELEPSSPASISRDEDINQIINQIADQFKGEIDQLKSTIDHLKKELETKDKKLKQGEVVEESELTAASIEASETEEITEEIPVTEEITEIKPKHEKPSLKLEEEIMDQIAKLKTYKKEKTKPVDLETIAEDKGEDISIPDYSTESSDESLEKPSENHVEPDKKIEMEDIPERQVQTTQTEPIAEDVTPVQEKPDTTVKSFVKLTPKPVTLNLGQFLTPEETYEEQTSKYGDKIASEEKALSSEPVEFTSIPSSSPQDEAKKELDEISVEDKTPEIPAAESKLEKIDSNLEQELEMEVESPVDIQAAEDKEKKPQVASIISDILDIRPDSSQKPSFIPEGRKTGQPKKISSEFVPFVSKKPKIAQVRVLESESKAKKKNSKELFKVLSQMGEKEQNISEKVSDPLNILIEKSKLKRSSEYPQKTASASSFFNSYQAKTSDSSVFSKSGNRQPEVDIIEELPQDKDLLYQELIALEGKRYSLEKSQKELEVKYKKGSISDMDYKTQLSNLKTELEYTTSRINKIRRATSRLY